MTSRSGAHVRGHQRHEDQKGRAGRGRTGPSVHLSSCSIQSDHNRVAENRCWSLEERSGLGTQMEKATAQRRSSPAH